MIYPNDHLPLHVHAIHGEGETLIALGNADVAPSVYESRGLSARLERRALEIVGENQE